MNNVHHRIASTLRLLALTAVFAFACGLPDSWHLLVTLVRS